MTSVAESLRRFLRHAEPAEVALTGGLAVEHHLAAAGFPPLRDRVGDLDFVARRVDAIAPSVTSDFLVAHYHRPGPAVRKALLQLVDPLARLRVDVFPDLDDCVAQANRTTIEDVALLVVDARSILRHKLETLRKATDSQPVDPKHRRDAVALAELLGEAAPPASAREAPATYCRDLEAVCARCEASHTPEYPLASKRKIFDVLGYV
jgi:hypothetical protein